MSSETESVHFIQLFQADGKNYYQACSTWCTSSDDDSSFRRLDLVFVDTVENRGFTATVDREMLETMNKLARGDDDIREWARMAFTSSCRDFSFSLDDREKHLVWKKGGAKVKIRLGSIPVSKIEASIAHDRIFSQVVEINARKEEQTKFEKSRNNELMENLKSSRRKLEELKEEKDNLEQRLYGLFLPILNSKQDKIRHLMKEIEDLERVASKRRSDDDEDDQEEDVEMEAAGKRPRHAISSSEDEDHPESDSQILDNPADKSIDSQNFLLL